MERLLTMEEVASYLRISKSTLYGWVKKQKIDSIKINGKILFKQNTIEEFVNQNQRSIDRTLQAF